MSFESGRKVADQEASAPTYRPTEEQLRIEINALMSRRSLETNGIQFVIKDEQLDAVYKLVVAKSDT